MATKSLTVPRPTVVHVFSVLQKVGRRKGLLGIYNPGKMELAKDRFNIGNLYS